MPIEIKELVIRAVVDYPDSDSSANAGSVTSESNPLPDQSELVKACVKQVLKTLRQQKKR